MIKSFKDKETEVQIYNPMTELNIYTGNRLENLMERLAESLREDPLPPMEKEIIVVQNKGMERWINLEIAKENSIAANIDFPFPKAFVYNLFHSFFDLPDESVFSPEIMTWKIMRELDSLLEEDHFSTLENYVKDDPFGLKKYQVSEKIALIFDQYIIARPDLINEWDNDENIICAKFPESKWQKILWNRISGKAGKEKSIHHADLRKIFLEKLNSKDFISDLNLPKRVSLFGISTLSPFYIEFFSKLSQFMEVNIYYLNPCREFWEYSFSDREILKFSEQGMDEEDQYYDQGNELLASMGTAGREFFSLLLNSVGHVGEELFFDPGTSTMLNTLQSDILNLVNRKDDMTIVFDERDTTVQVHSCHGPIREIEILYDNLLAVFEENQDITPRDIVVMMPSVTSYAPFIHAVFDARMDKGKQIPFSIADTVKKSANSVANGFMSILLLGKNRYNSSDILDLLERESVRNRFNITLDNLEFIKGWVKDTNTCWGVDGEYKKGLGLPAFHENTWRFGLERMLLGHAIPCNEGYELFSGILPYGEIEGEGAVILGRFTNFVESLFSAVKALNQNRTLVQWAEILNKILNDFFKLDETTEHDINEIRGLFTENGLSGIADAADFQGDVSFEIIKSFIEKHIDSCHGDRGFITTGVTFCTLLPMRSIPFKVVYLAGMNDGEYPGTFQRPGFDLMEKKRELCDWSKRNEDKYLFLESVLSAREKLFISYTGQSIKDNREIPPSVLVSELLDYLNMAYSGSDGNSLHDHVVIKHPLQPFSRRYFTGEKRFFSYSMENFCAAVESVSEKKEKLPLIRDDLMGKGGYSNVDQHFKEISVDDLVNFFANPCRFIVKNILNAELDVDDYSAVETREPFDLDFLEQYFIKDELLSFFVEQQEKVSKERPAPKDNRGLEVNIDNVVSPGNRENKGDTREDTRENKENKDDLSFFHALKASGRLPHGKMGYAEFKKNETEVKEFVDNLRPYILDRVNGNFEVKIIDSGSDFNAVPEDDTYVSQESEIDINVKPGSAVKEEFGSDPDIEPGSDLKKEVGSDPDIELGSDIKREVKFDADMEYGSGISVKAVFNNLFNSGQVFFRCAKIKPKDILHAWFYHLLFNLIPDYKKERVTLLFGIDGSMKFSQIKRDAALAELAKIVSLFRQGLNFPLSFFQNTSFAFAEAVINKNKGDLDALKAAEKKWYSGFYNSRGENEDIYIKACFGEELPEIYEFKENALKVFELILKTRENLDH